MAKRVYTETVKKWLIRSGIIVGTIIGGIFLYLFAIGAISNVSYSGDTVCAGTELDPCYAYINFTANEDIFIYPTDYDPWGRETLFDFDPAVKSWKLQRSWGSGWRNIPLDRSCTGTWCGLSSSKDTRKFSVAFREGRDYQIRIVAYKNSPYDTIKWGAFSGVDEIDPVWKSPYENKYTPGSETHCKDGVCNLILYSGIRFVEEDKNWKNVEDARSLKGSGVECVVESDGENLVECVDWNYTNIELRLSKDSVSLTSKEVPIKIYERNVSNYSQLILKSEVKESFSLLSNQKDVGLSNFNYGDIIHFGDKSTTIQLQDADSENLKDALVSSNTPTTNYGTSVTLRWGVYNPAVLRIYRSYITFNLSQLPDNVGINESSISFKWVAGFEHDYAVHHVYDDWKNDTGSNILNETQIHWNNQPCGGTSFDNDTNCNLTYEDNNNIDAGGWWTWDVTNAMIKDYGRMNISFVGKAKVEETIGSDYGDFHSKEYAVDTTFRPYLNITYFTNIYVNITDPTTANSKSVSSGDNITITYNYVGDGINITSGVTTDTVLIGGTVANPILYDYNDTIETKVPSSCSDAFLNTGVRAYSNWTTTGIGTKKVVKFLLWQYDASMGTTEQADIRFYLADGTGIAGSNITINGTGVNEWTSVEYPIPFEITLGESYYVGIALPNAQYNLARDTGANCANYLPNDGSWYTANAGDLAGNVPFSTQSSFHYGIFGIGYYNLTQIEKTIYTSGIGWQHNVTVPTFASGLKDLFLNATWNLHTENETQTNAISYGVTDTCTYSSGNWAVDCLDNCSIDSNVNLGGNNISLSGAGHFDISANITNFNKIFLWDTCDIRLYPGGQFI